MESQNTTFPQHERSEAERVRGPQRMRQAWSRGPIDKLLLTCVELCKLYDYFLTLTSDCHGLELLSSHSLC